MATLYPRLTAGDAVSLWEALKDKSVEQLKQSSSSSHPRQFFAAVGGQRIQAHEMDGIALRIRKIASEFGYPEEPRRSALADFDTEVAIYLGTELDIPPGEAYRPETWGFLSLVVLPDIVKWRFPQFHAARCTGGRRDCFQRLWLRAQAFDLGEDAHNRWGILRNLTEDSFVSILERPSLGGNHELCKVLGLAWMKTASSIGKGRMEAVNRRAIKRIRSKGTVLVLDALSRGELRALAEQCYLAESVL